MSSPGNESATDGIDRKTAEKVLSPVVEAARDEGQYDGRYEDDEWVGIVLDSVLSADLGLSTSEKNRLVDSLSDYNDRSAETGSDRNE